MEGLLLKDIVNLKKSGKQIVLAIAVLAVFALSMKNAPYLIGMAVLMTSMLVMTSIAYDEAAKWDKYALTMPLVKKDIVLEKYVLLVLLTVVGGVVSGIFGCIMTVVLKSGKMIETLAACGVIMMVALLMFSLVLPVLFRFGVEKARMIMFIIFGAPAFLLVVFAKLMEKYNVPKPTDVQMEHVLYVSPFIVALVFVLSYRISVGIYEKKEL